MPKLRTLAAPILLLLTLAVHAPTLGGGLLADDYSLLQFFHQDQASDDTPDMHAGPLWATFFQRVPAEQRPKYHRPLTFLSLFVDHAVFGTWAPGFRAVQLALCLAAVMLLFALVEALGGGRGLAFATAAGFALFPTNYASLQWISDRGAWLALVLGIASLLLFVRKLAASDRGLPWASGLCLLLALLAKESAVVLAALFPLLWLLRHRGAPGARADADPASRTSPRVLVPMVLALVVVLAWRGWRLGTLMGGPRSIDQYSLGVLLADQLSVLRVLLVPIRAQAFPGLFSQWLELPVLMVLGWSLVRCRHRRLLCFGEGWLLLSLLPNLYDAVLPGSQVNARFTMPSAAPFALCVALAVQHWSTLLPRIAGRLVLPLVLALVAVVLLCGNRAAFVRAGERAPAILARLHALAAGPGRPVAIYELPSYDDNAPLCLNAFPYALRHPFLDRRQREVHAFDSGPKGMYDLVRAQSDLARTPDLVWMRWDPLIDAPVQTAPIEAIDGRGELRLVDGNPVFAPTGQRLRGFREDLRRYAGKLVELRGLSFESHRGSEILVVSIREL